MAEVPHSLAGVLGAAQEHGVGALGRPERQLVKGDALSTSREDAGAGGLGEPESAHYTTRCTKRWVAGQLSTLWSHIIPIRGVGSGRPASSCSNIHRYPPSTPTTSQGD